MRWLTRTYWLKTKGTRERLKEVLDDARSRLKEQLAPETEVVEKSVSKVPFHALSLACPGLCPGAQPLPLDPGSRGLPRGRSQGLHGAEHAHGIASLLSAWGFDPGCRSLRLAWVLLQGKVDMNLDLHQGELFLQGGGERWGGLFRKRKRREIKAWSWTRPPGSGAPGRPAINEPELDPIRGPLKPETGASSLPGFLGFLHRIQDLVGNPEAAGRVSAVEALHMEVGARRSR